MIWNRKFVENNSFFCSELKFIEWHTWCRETGVLPERWLAGLPHAARSNCVYPRLNRLWVRFQSPLYLVFFNPNCKQQQNRSDYQYIHVQNETIFVCVWMQKKGKLGHSLSMSCFCHFVIGLNSSAHKSFVFIRHEI